MKQLIGFEFQKILNKKIVLVCLLGAVCFNLFLSLNWTGSKGVLTSDGKVLKGREGIRYMQEYDRNQGGKLTDEKIQELLQGGYFEREVLDSEAAEEMYRYDMPNTITYIDRRFSGTETQTMEEILHRKWEKFISAIIRDLLLFSTV